MRLGLQILVIVKSHWKLKHIRDDNIDNAAVFNVIFVIFTLNCVNIHRQLSAQD